MKILSRFVVSCLWTFLGCVCLQAQKNVDSLRQIVNQNPPDSIKIDTYISLAVAIRGTDETKEMEYLDKAITLSEQLDDKRRISLSYLKLARYYDRKGMLPQAQKALSKVEKQLLHFRDTKIEATFYMLRGIIHYYEGTYNLAVADMFEAIPRYESMGDSTAVGSCYINLGVNHVQLEHLDEAINYYLKGLKIYDAMGYEKGVAMATGNIGEIYKSKENYDKALEYYNRSLQVNEKYGYQNEAMIDLNNIGSLYLAKEDFKNALLYNTRSLEMAELLDSQWDMLLAKYNLASTEFKMGHYNKAVDSFQEIIKTAESLNYKEFVKDAHHTLSEVYLAMGKPWLAMDHRKKYETWKDGLLNESHLKEVKELELQYETEKKDQEIMLLSKEKVIQEQEIRRQATLKNSFIAVGALIATLGVLIGYTLIQRLKNQRALASKNEELRETNFKRRLTELEMRALQAQINPHFIFNAMNSINQMIRKGNNARASQYLTKFSKLIRSVLENADEAEVSLKDELFTLQTYMQLEALRFKENIDFEIEVQDDIEQESTYLPAMVLQPFVENAIWHGLKHKKKPANGKIHIAIHQEEDHLKCQIEDNGVGRQRALELQQKSILKRKSMGLKITEDRLRLLSNGLKDKLIQITDLKGPTGIPLGTRVEVSIPIS